MRRRTVLVLGLNLLFALVIAGWLGPAPSKLEARFGLVGWAGRAPFYLLLLYVGPALLAMRGRTPWPVRGTLVGSLAALPLALFALATDCSVLVQAGYLLGGVLEGLVLARLAAE